MPLGLPTVPVELKSIAPYVQRADEVKQTEPIIAYWCSSVLRKRLGHGFNQSRQVSIMRSKLASLSVQKVPMRANTS
jgi:hypothetical protein